MQTVRLPQSELEKALSSRPKHIFVAGASRGMGEAIARALGDEPHNLTLGARSYNKVLGISMDLGTARALPVRLDLTDQRSIDEAVVSAESRFGPIDALVVASGVNAETPLEDLSSDARARFRHILEVNLFGTYFLAQLVTAHMPNGGRVLFIGSVLARFGGTRSSAYTASKHAILGLTRSMASELAPRGIRVNVLNPGWVDTQMAHDVLSRMAQSSGQTLQQTTAAMMASQPIRRMIKPTEVGAYAKFLLGPGGDAITGQGIDLSCGAVMI
jgi:NAD(P)-dependent dehydrogenase (short-subunit alcohol dehydrogenase family)